jgi:hypothetical protein
VLKSANTSWWPACWHRRWPACWFLLVEDCGPAVSTYAGPLLSLLWRCCGFTCTHVLGGQHEWPSWLLDGCDGAASLEWGLDASVRSNAPCLWAVGQGFDLHVFCGVVFLFIVGGILSSFFCWVNYLLQACYSSNPIENRLVNCFPYFLIWPLGFHVWFAAVLVGAVLPVVSYC